MASKVIIPNTFATATTAIPLSQLDSNFSNINAAINNAITFSNYAVDTGGVNAYAITISGQTTTYAAGIAFQFKAANTNTGASTLNVNGQGAQTIVRTDGSALVAGDITAGAIVSVMFDGTNFQLMNDAGGKSETISNLTVTGTATIATANIASFSPSITNNQLANSNVTIGNATVSLGGTATTVGNLTLQNATISSVSTPITAAQGGTGQTSLTAENVLLGNGTASVKLVAPGTTGNVLTSNGTTWVSQASISSMVYPGAGIAVSTGSAWTTSKTSPTGTIVGTSDSQTLTNKTLGSGLVMNASAITSETSQNSTSGTSIDFTGIPSWVKRITVMFNGVSTNGTSIVQIQIGSGSFTTSGYTSIYSLTGSATANGSSTTGFIVSGNSGGTDTRIGNIVLCLQSGNTWVVNGVVCTGVANNVTMTAGLLALSGTLDRLRVTTINGTDTFDAGSINILYE